MAGGQVSRTQFSALLAAETPLISELTGEVNWRVYESHLPLFGSLKKDGIRGTQRDGVIVSRSGKKIPSAFAQSLCRPEFEGLDGELLAATIPPGETVYHASFSAVMTHGATTPLVWHVFDKVTDPNEDYQSRLDSLYRIFIDGHIGDLPIVRLEQRLLVTVAEIQAMEREALDGGDEGLIVRRADAPYKFGRSTELQGYLLKLARTQTSEAVIVGFEERMHNENEAFKNEVGYQKRSSDKAGLRPAGMLGAFICRDDRFTDQFKIGIGDGWDHAFLTEVWRNQEKYLTKNSGNLLKYTYKHYGTKDKPRQPKGIGWRNKDDLS
jgi:DNA ligase-1